MVSSGLSWRVGQKDVRCVNKSISIYNVADVILLHKNLCLLCRLLLAVSSGPSVQNL